MTVLLHLYCTLLVTVSSPAPRPAYHANLSLATAAQLTNRTFGSAVVPESLYNDPTYAQIASSQFGLFVAENATKWDATEPNPGQFSFGSADSMVQFAQARGIKTRGHVLVWHNQLPGWVNGSMTPDALHAAMINHINGVLQHFRGVMESWDVVNEAIADGGDGAGDAAGLKSTLWTDKLGDAFIDDAFRAARQADPGTLLFYNDYGAEGGGPKADRIYNLVSGMLARGVPIDGVGFQAHMNAASMPSEQDIIANLNRFTALGLRVRFTEVDVADASVPGTIEQKRLAEAHGFYTLAHACLQVSGCDTMITWEFSDNYSWLPSFTGNPSEEGLMYDVNYQPKPALWALRNALLGQPFTADAAGVGTSLGPIEALSNTNLCLDATGANPANGTPLQLWTCNNSDAQAWNTIGSTLHAMGKCLDLPGNNQVNGAHLQLWDCNGSPAQNWQYNPSNHVFQLANTNKCIDISSGNIQPGTPIQLFDCDGAPAQQWQPQSNAPSSVVSLATAANPSYCLDVAGGQSVNGMPIQVWQCWGGVNQQWTFANGAIQALGKCLDVPGNNATNGQTLQIWDCAGNDNQRWNYDPVTNLISKPGTTKCLDLAGGVAQNGAKPILWDCHGGTNQQWLPASH